MQPKSVLMVCLLTTSLCVSPVPLTGNEPPHVDAGLDQTVYAGSTVLLDGSGTTDPDGTISSYTWEIRDPEDDRVEPACRSCERTRFRANETGTYTVTLTATDDDGASANDTLYVTVTPDDGPSVTLTGPVQATPGAPVTVTATPNPGSEPIRDLSWAVEGSPITGSNASTLTRTFASTVSYTLSVTVTDAIGRTASATHEVLVSNSSGSAPNGSNGSTPGNGTTPPPTNPIVTPTPGGPPANGTPDNSSNSSDNTSTIADSFDPHVTGPQLVLGDRPLEATYSLANAPPAAKIASIRWRVNGKQSAGSRGINVRWPPGDHTLEAYVEYTDGSDDIARFQDGTNTITADPAPELALPNVTLGTDRLEGAFDVVDHYGNIQSVDVTVDDTTVFDGYYPGTAYQQRTHVTNTYTYDDIYANTNYTVTLTATDDNGQTRTLSRTITPDDGPEVIANYFIDDTTDTYHPRIAPDRYTAEHVVKIDLNDYPRTEVDIGYMWWPNDVRQSGDQRISYNHETDILTVRSYWYGLDVKTQEISTNMTLGGSNPTVIGDSTFRVTPSPPELRLTSPTEGTKKNFDGWGMVVNAERSFDPDGTPLSIKWLQGAQRLSENRFAAKLDPQRMAGIRIKDGSDATTEELDSFLPYYIPGIREQSMVTSGPYNGSDYVTFEIRTDSYAFTKNPNRYNISLGARSNSSAVHVRSVSKEKVPLEEVSEYVAIQDRLYRWVVRVEIRANALNDGQNWVTLYNEDSPERITVSRELGEVDVRSSQRKEDVVVDDVYYKVENESGQETRKTTSRSTVRSLEEQGWTVDETNEVIESVVIERLTTETVTRTETHRFENRRRAQRVARANSGWQFDGMETQTRTVEGTRTEWVRDATGGQFTGQTREVVSNPNAVRTLRQFQYYTTETRQTWTEVTKEVEVTVTEYREEDREICRRPSVCFVTTVEVPYTTTKTVEREVRKQVTETTRVHHTYWSEAPQRPGHTSTGATKSVRTEPREYVTEYQVIVPYERTVTEEQYVVTATIEETRETWEFDTRVSSMTRARSIARSNDRRIGEITKEQEWVLVKNKTVTEIVQEYDDEGNVITTYATVSGTLVYGPNPGETREFTIHLEFDGVATEQEIYNATMELEITCNGKDGDCHA